MSELNNANADKMWTELVQPILGLAQDRQRVGRDAENLLNQLRARAEDDLEFAYQVRNRIIKMLAENGIEPLGGTGNLFAEVRNGMPRLDPGLDKDGMPTLRDYEVKE